MADVIRMQKNSRDNIHYFEDSQVPLKMSMTWIGRFTEKDYAIPPVPAEWIYRAACPADEIFDQLELVFFFLTLPLENDRVGYVGTARDIRKMEIPFLWKAWKLLSKKMPARALEEKLTALLRKSRKKGAAFLSEILVWEGILLIASGGDFMGIFKAFEELFEKFNYQLTFDLMEQSIAFL